MNVVLIGMRGSGKSTVAKLLAVRLGWHYVELDEAIAKKEGMAISDIVAEKGWHYFRERESEVVEIVASSDKIVISTGGGVVLREKNMVALKRNGICVFLLAPMDSLFEHVGGEDSELPRLTEQGSMREEIEEVWKIREPLYRKAADEILGTKQLTLEGVVEEILQRLQKRHIQ